MAKCAVCGARKRKAAACKRCGRSFDTPDAATIASGVVQPPWYLAVKCDSPFYCDRSECCYGCDYAKLI